jgi:hypothetical protein
MTDTLIEHLGLEPLIDRLGLLGEEILTELRHLRAERTTGAEARSSVQLDQDSKGQVKLTVKRYADSPFDEIGEDAIEEFARLFREVERLQMQGWRDTVEALQAGRDR